MTYEDLLKLFHVICDVEKLKLTVAELTDKIDGLKTNHGHDRAP